MVSVCRLGSDGPDGHEKRKMTVIILIRKKIWLSRYRISARVRGGNREVNLTKTFNSNHKSPGFVGTHCTYFLPYRLRHCGRGKWLVEHEVHGVRRALSPSSFNV